MKTILAMIMMAAALVCVQTQAQPSAVMEGLQNMFDVHDTNSLLHANEVSLTPLAKWNSKDEKIGGGLKLDWWISDQQGVALEYDEFSDRSAYWQLGYQARTVFRGLEVALGAGTRQAEAEDFGAVRLYLQPSFKWHIYHTEKLDLALTVGADMIAGQKPNPFLGVGFTFWRF